MSGNRYRAVHPSYVAIYGDEPFDHEFADVGEEAELLAAGYLELVPRPYRVLSDLFTVDGAPVAQGDVIEAAYPIDIEAMLTAPGGHLERVDTPTTKKAATRRAATTKE